MRALDDVEIDRIVAGIRAGETAMVGGSRCHVTYRVGDGDAFIAEDFDEGFTEESAIPEVTLRAIIRGAPESFVEILRTPLRARLREALLVPVLDRGAREIARARVDELLVYGACLTRGDLLVALLAWPETRPSRDDLTRMTKDLDGLDLHHVVMSAIGYGSRSEAAGRFGDWVFAVVAEMLGDETMPRFEEYRATFRAMASGARSG